MADWDDDEEGNEPERGGYGDEGGDGEPIPDVPPIDNGEDGIVYGGDLVPIGVNNITGEIVYRNPNDSRDGMEPEVNDGRYAGPGEPVQIGTDANGDPIMAGDTAALQQEAADEAARAAEEAARLGTAPIPGIEVDTSDGHTTYSNGKSDEYPDERGDDEGERSPSTTSEGIPVGAVNPYTDDKTNPEDFAVNPDVENDWSDGETVFYEGASPFHSEPDGYGPTDAGDSEEQPMTGGELEESMGGEYGRPQPAQAPAKPAAPNYVLPPIDFGRFGWQNFTSGALADTRYLRGIGASALGVQPIQTRRVGIDYRGMGGPRFSYATAPVPAPNPMQSYLSRWLGPRGR